MDSAEQKTIDYIREDCRLSQESMTDAEIKENLEGSLFFQRTLLGFRIEELKTEIINTFKKILHINT